MKQDIAAPVVPAEGPISTLEMVYRNMPDIPELPEAYQPRNIARSLAALRSAPPVGGDMGNPITMIYRNYRGEVTERTVIPRRIWFGSTDWHPEPGWLMSAYDPDKAADRDFALADCDFRRIAPPVGARVKPLVWREDRDTWVSDCEVGTYRVGFDDGWWCSLEGAESWDWDSPDDPRSYHGPSTAQNAAQADFVARILAALLPAGEGE